MAERRGVRARHPALLLPLAAALALAFAPACRAELKFTPGVSLSETYTDNVNLATPDLARREFITDLAPSFGIVEDNRRLKLSALYRFHVYQYSDKDAPNTYHSNRQLDASLLARVIDDFLFVDASAARGRQALSAFGPQLTDNGYSAVNRTEVSSWRVSPYIRQRFGATADMTVRYTRDAVTTSTRGFGNTHGEDILVSLASNPERRLGWNLNFDHQHLTDRLAGDSLSKTLNAGLSYRIQPSLALTAGGGYDDYDYQALGGRTRGASWNAGFDWNPSPRTSLSASTGRRYYGSSHALSALHRSRHTVWKINYDEQVTTTRQQYLLPAAIDTADMLDRLFMASIPDPQARRQAVEAYLRATGLPTSLANDINYLSNRYMLQKQFQASAGFNGAHSLLLLSAFDTRRTALSVQQSDSALLGSTLSSLNDNVHQQGLSLDFNYRLSSRSQATAAASVGHTDSLTTGIRQNNRALRLGLSHQFQRKLNGALELRRVQGSVGASSAMYTENALAAILSMTL